MASFWAINLNFKWWDILLKLGATHCFLFHLRPDVLNIQGFYGFSTITVRKKRSRAENVSLFRTGKVSSVGDLDVGAEFTVFR